MKALETRIPPPLVSLLIAGLMWGSTFFITPISMNYTVRIVAVFIFLCIGIFFCAAGVISFRRAKTTVNPLKPEEASSLVNSGIYKFTRNPMYVGFAIILFAWAAYLASPFSFIGIIFFLLYMTYLQIIPEERALTKLFESEFINYQKQVRRWL